MENLSTYEIERIKAQAAERLAIPHCIVDGRLVPIVGNHADSAWDWEWLAGEDRYGPESGLYLFWIADTFDPPVYASFGEHCGDAHEEWLDWLDSNRPGEALDSAMVDELRADGLEETITYSPNGKPYNSESIGIRYVSDPPFVGVDFSDWEPIDTSEWIEQA